MERIQKAKAGFRSLTEVIDTTSPAGRMMMQMVGSFAEFEREMLRSAPSGLGRPEGRPHRRPPAKAETATAEGNRAAGHQGTEDRRRSRQAVRCASCNCLTVAATEPKTQGLTVVSVPLLPKTPDLFGRRIRPRDTGSRAAPSDRAAFAREGTGTAWGSDAGAGEVRCPAWASHRTGTISSCPTERRTREWVRDLQEALKAKGLRAFLHETELEPGTNWPRLGEALLQSRFLALIITRQTVTYPGSSTNGHRTWPCTARRARPSQWP